MSRIKFSIGHSHFVVSAIVTASEQNFNHHVYLNATSFNLAMTSRYFTVARLVNKSPFQLYHTSGYTKHWL